jgi:hypothetical protein
MIKRIVTGTVLSALIFLSISFVTVLLQINSPLHRQTNDNLDIGFPIPYYSQFMVDAPIPNSGWEGKNLVFDIFITWTVVTGIYLFLTKKATKTEAHSS